MTYFVYIFITLLCATSIAAQKISPQQIQQEVQRATVLEQQNNLSEALAIYRQLYAQYPARADILLRMENILTKTGQQAEAATLLRQHLRTSPKDIVTRLKLGDALFAQGKRDSAIIEWESLLKDANTPHLYALVADKYRKNSIPDRAIAIYHQARTTLNNPELYARELAELLERQAQYVEAIREYLTFMHQQPQYRTLIEARLRDYAQNGDHHDQIFNLLKKELQTQPTDRNLTGLLIEFALPAGYAAQALNVLQNTPDLPDNSWTYLTRIAHYALEANDFDTATRAYQILYTTVERADVRARALLGLAHTNIRAQHPKEARTYFQAVIDQFENRPESDEARFHIGLFQRDVDKDWKAAQKTFQILIDSSRKTDWRYRALFELAEGYARTDDFAPAEEAYQRILAERKIGPDAAQARFMLAELRYFSGAFEEAKLLYQAVLTQNLEQNVANDAIMRMALIQAGEQNDSDQLRVFAQAELKQYQQKFDAARQAFQTLQEQHPQTFLLDRILYQKAELLETLKRYPEAIQQHRQLIFTQKESPLCPMSQMALAKIYEMRLGQYLEAKQAYETLLVEYPLSIEADDAREHLRAIQQKIQELERKKEPG